VKGTKKVKRGGEEGIREASKKGGKQSARGLNNRKNNKKKNESKKIGWRALEETKKKRETV